MQSSRVILAITFVIFTFDGFAQQTDTLLTRSLLRRFNDAWNREDISKMVSLMDSTVFFKSPFQIRYGIDTVAATVLITNPPRFKFSSAIEQYSHVENDLAWSIGIFSLDIYDSGTKTSADPNKGEYIYVFRNRSGDWKLQMIIFHKKDN